MQALPGSASGEELLTNAGVPVEDYNEYVEFVTYVDEAVNSGSISEGEAAQIEDSAAASISTTGTVATTSTNPVYNETVAEYDAATDVSDGATSVSQGSIVASEVVEEGRNTVAIFASMILIVTVGMALYFINRRRGSVN